jgi:hypothetical protein
MRTQKVKEFLTRNRASVTLIGVVLALTAIPALLIYSALGTVQPKILPMFIDESFYLSRVQAVGEGYLAGGHPYFFEHRNDPPLVIFGGVWINAVPLLAGLSLYAAVMFNFVMWSLFFALVLYWLFREFRCPPWVAAVGTLFLYIESYSHVWRTVNLQPVYPFYFLYYLSLFRVIREQSRRNIIFLGVSVGATFYLFAYLWQIAILTLGILFLFALVRKNWMLMRAALISSVIGGTIGLPIPLYALWLSRTSPYFWESVGRLGLVNTHLPMAEVLYSGGWIGLLLALMAILWWRARTLRDNEEFILLCVFIGVSGLGLWIMQGSNIITGKLLETGEHIRRLLVPWLIFSTISAGVLLWKLRGQITRTIQVISIVAFALLSLVCMQYTYRYVTTFFTVTSHDFWRLQQTYAGPFNWLEQSESTPVVVWSNPHDFLSTSVPIYTKHFTLYTWAGLMELAPEGEIRERYLVSHYFDGLSVADLRSNAEMDLYLGRHDFPHAAKTIERRIKLCRILFFWDRDKSCGSPPTPAELLGDAFFENLEKKYLTDIRPNINAYLDKYHVKYILKDTVLDPQYQPEMLGAKLVYSDDRYELYRR